MRSAVSILTLVTLAGCSTTVFDRTSCATNPECQEAWGLGTTCGSEGYCEVAELHPRCEQTFPEGLTLPIDPEQYFVIGTNFDHSLETHVGRYQSAQLAAIQANANDGLNGRTFAMIHCTNAEDATFDALDKTAAAVETAIWQSDVIGLSAIVGPAASVRAEAIYNAVADEYDTLVISPSATSPSLTPIDGLQSTDEDPGLFWRTVPPDDLQGFAIADDMRNHFDPDRLTVWRAAPSARVAVVHQTGAYGDGLADSFRAAFLAAGGVEVVAWPFSDPSGRSDSLAQAANGDFDELLFVSSDAADIVAFLQGAATLGSLAETPLFLTDAARNADVLNATEGAAAGLLPHVRGTAPANPAGAVYDSFKVNYAAEYGGADVSVLSFTAQSFDAAWMVIYAHAWAGGTAPGGTELARGLRHLSAGEPVEVRPNNWNLVKATFEQRADVNIQGASGALDYDASGETTATIDVWTVNGAGDGFVVAHSIEP